MHKLYDFESPASLRVASYYNDIKELISGFFNQETSPLWQASYYDDMGVEIDSQALRVGWPNKNFASFQGKDCGVGL
jgi:hypothetical protein